jgi:endo-1,4-beta-xylanase
MPEGANDRVEHGTYYSDLMALDVGYAVYLPPDYETAEEASRSYPVVYFLPGGRVGNEVKSLALADFFDEWIQSGIVRPRLVVFVNGGKEGYFDYEDSKGESTIVQELIPHIDKTYRTIPDRMGRAIEGFSMGGRGAARIMFKYPELFCSGAAMAGGHQKERAMSEDEGREARGLRVLAHSPTNNTWDLARDYAARDLAPELQILVAVGSDDMNYQGNLDWMDHLRTLGISFEQEVPSGVSHDVSELFEALGPAVEAFHDRCLGSLPAGG